ncbi:MAG: CarD family transcriptional regulator [Anaerolineales bacterium]
MAARNKKKDFEVGNWIVHPIYGVGQISRIEEKCVNETTCAYFRVEADETTYWIPVDCVEDSRVRKVISRSAFRRAEATQKMTNLLNQNQAQASTEDALDPIGKSVELA